MQINFKSDSIDLEILIDKKLRTLYYPECPIPRVGEYVYIGVDSTGRVTKVEYDYFASTYCTVTLEGVSK